MTGIGSDRGVTIINGQLPSTAASTQLSRTVDPLGTFSASKLSRSKQFFQTFAPRAAFTLAMHVGTPVIAVMTPALLERFGEDLKNNVPANLIAGSALGGTWGALVGAAIPVNYAGVRVPRIRNMGVGAASGIVLAPAVAGVSRLVVDWFATPLNAQNASLEDAASGVKEQTSKPRETRDGG